VPTDVLADRLGSTRGAIYKTLHDARRKLRARLAGDGLAVTSAAVEPSTARVRTSFEVAAVGELGAGRRELTGLSIGTRARRRLHRRHDERCRGEPSFGRDESDGRPVSCVRFICGENGHRVQARLFTSCLPIGSAAQIGPRWHSSRDGVVARPPRRIMGV
jgi:hypothetical protein